MAWDRRKEQGQGAVDRVRDRACREICEGSLALMDKNPTPGGVPGSRGCPSPEESRQQEWWPETAADPVSLGQKNMNGLGGFQRGSEQGWRRVSCC